MNLKNFDLVTWGENDTVYLIVKIGKKWWLIWKPEDKNYVGADYTKGRIEEAWDLEMIKVVGHMKEV